MKGKLDQYFTDLDLIAQGMYVLLIRQYVELERVVELIKAAENLKWKRRMNSIRNRVENL